MRWWRELKDPGLKCERVGHDPREERTAVFLYPPEHWSRAVADRAVEVETRCRRCRKLFDSKIVERSGIHGLTMPSDRWERLRTNGRIER